MRDMVLQPWELPHKGEATGQEKLSAKHPVEINALFFRITMSYSAFAGHHRLSALLQSHH